MSESISNKLRFFSSFLILLVVYLHGYYLEGEQYPATNYFMNFLCGGICGVANYMFFLISGFLFFNNVTKLNDICIKIKKRTKTLLVPYVIWNLIFVLWFVLLSLIPALSERFVNGSIVTSLKNSSLLEALNLIFIEPASYQLWFLRDLMVLVVASPLIWLLLKYFRWILPVVLIIGSAFLPKLGFVAMFALGGYLATSNVNIEDLTAKVNKWLPLFAFIYLGTALLYPFHFGYLKAIYALTFLFGIITLWCLYDRLRMENVKWYQPFLGYSFFIYCFHIPFFNIIKKINILVLGDSQWSVLFLFFVNPIIAVLLIIMIAKLVQRFWPKGYHVLTGFRK